MAAFLTAPQVKHLHQNAGNPASKPLAKTAPPLPCAQIALPGAMQVNLRPPTHVKEVVHIRSETPVVKTYQLALRLQNSMDKHRPSKQKNPPWTPGSRWIPPAQLRKFSPKEKQKTGQKGKHRANQKRTGKGKQQ